jgi:hypothetical protein
VVAADGDDPGIGQSRDHRPVAFTRLPFVRPLVTRARAWRSYALATLTAYQLPEFAPGVVEAAFMKVATGIA